ncbi:MAG: glycoside hydrolase family 5 protein [Rhizomicrobium sp.]|nr:glycoside hydrolase family 5 protein [Rhizomicrobium sp.]
MFVDRLVWAKLPARLGLLVAFGLALSISPLRAEASLSQTVNDPSAAWNVSGTLATAELIKDPEVTGGTAERIKIAAKGANAWDVVAYTPTTKPVHKGDVLLLAFWAKAFEPPKGRERSIVVAKLQLSEAPYTGLGSDTALRVTAGWKLYYVNGVADKDYAAGKIGASLQLASAAQTLDFGPIVILDFGPGYDTAKLPVNAASFALLAVPPPIFAQPFKAIDAAAQNAAMGRGVNVLGYDPVWSDPQDARFQPRHFTRIHEAGFQTLRVVLQSFDHMDSANRLDPEWLKTLDGMIAAALSNGLNVILDEHDFDACGKDAITCRVKVKAFWSQIAPRYKDAPAQVMFEILNEPSRALTPELWNALSRESLAIIRVSNPTRNVIIGPAWWNSLDHLAELALPAEDAHIIVTFHYYTPMTFTHQGAAWASAELGKLSGVTWGSDADYALMTKDFDTVKAWSEANHRPIFLGEFGNIESAPMESRLRWDTAVVRAAEAHGFSWAYWQFDPGFAVYDMAKDEWIAPILHALIPAAKP